MVLVLVLGDIFIPTRTHDLPAKFKKLLVPGKIQQIVSTGNVCDRETWEYLRGVAPDLRGVRGEYDENPALPPSLVLQHGPLRIGVLHGHQVVPLGDTEALSAVARKMDVDVLISGGTHRFEAFEYDGRFFINPGSATGAFSPLWTPPAPAADPAETAEEPAPNGTEGKAAASDEAAASSNEKADDTKSPASNETPAPQTDSKPDPASLSTYPPTPIPSFALLDIQGTVVVTYVYQLVDGEVRVEKIEHRKA
ncbi:Metallo-dependent phosphatase-like protein [Leucosporidium creatinivorum]|uniref:Vacuolar protein sorting-associated protein 29 n=1 Tax=Leucosporidium creatinivorum TaxID=106004 RepID=A0A1Y2FU49_9BASI|nr:Metallo-dependent phosphatase-like protein [Leucosporidium creatinivorum]